ncbi:hypothetical protein E0H77_09560 [Acinetobacter sp. ANC 4633]|uniref:hypothetical protein n=1 Tax=Acinetobacter sp. ANC 4633 TaxID=2529845 RepID=UPI001040B238|nr:hypothetical protein [Acinetobacter sp. ANC 4633]TCB25309.1 hypothetical protein E0H77_09560 [Acinetobacter sp. ANC 4633]
MEIYFDRVTFLLSGKTSALTCMQLAKIADDNADTPRTKYSFVVKGGKGFRTYFHSAPSHECKIDGLFIIPQNSVIAYQYFKNQNKQWMYVMYIDENGKDTEGWVLKSDFKMTGYINSPLEP